VDLQRLKMSASVAERHGVLTFEVTAVPLGETKVASATLTLSRQGHRYSTALETSSTMDGAVTLRGRLEVPDVELWWPHTHGQPSLYDARLEIGALGVSGAADSLDIDLGQVGFRTVSLDRSNGDFALRVNGHRIFCRGAVWTPLDCVSLNCRQTQYADALAQVRAAGMNMLRVAGPFVYESDEFLDLCDSTGVLLWQEFMFANMDYPASDPGFLENVRTEATQVLQRLQARPALAVLCGNSEVYQQAAMSAAPRELWSAPLFEETLADLSRQHCPDVPYCPSSAHGGEFPFTANHGAASYYGIGAYLRPLDDARRSQLRFASECLAFANVSEDQQRWKERTPRDLGAGWDFDDVRDHYLEKVLRVEARTLRYSDQDRYLRCSRVVTGEVMGAAFAEWRRARSSCNGALVLFLRDLWPGAGWGVIDSTGLPKAPYYYLKRTLQSTALLVTDEGPNGLALHLVNEGGSAIRGQLQIQLYRSSHAVGRPVSRAVDVAANTALELNAVELFEGFIDLSYYYRFGPCSYDVLYATFNPEHTGAPLEAFHFPTGLPNSQGDVGLQATARLCDGSIHVDIESRDFAQSVHISAPGYIAEDQYFHVAPRGRRTVRLLPRHDQAPEEFEGTVQALNCGAVHRIGLSP
jgi:beta-mannosidase